MRYVHKKPRANADEPLRYGWYQGRSLYGDRNLVALHDGAVTRIRAMVRSIPSHRWNATCLDTVTGVPATSVHYLLSKLNGNCKNNVMHPHNFLTNKKATWRPAGGS